MGNRLSNDIEALKHERFRRIRQGVVELIRDMIKGDAHESSIKAWIFNCQLEFSSCLDDRVTPSCRCHSDQVVFVFIQVTA